MPDGFSETGTKNAATLYYQHKQDYPYQMYMNWNPSNEGNILYNDKKFVTLCIDGMETRLPSTTGFQM
ncbi:MAG: hypothetical protein ACLTML_02600 [Blautia faecis]